MLSNAEMFNSSLFKEGMEKEIMDLENSELKFLIAKEKEEIYFKVYPNDK